MCRKKLIKKGKLLASWCKKNARQIFNIFFLILYPMTIVVFMGFVVRYTFTTPFISSLRWIYKFPVPFTINCLIVLSITIFLWLLTKRKIFSVALVSILMAVMSLINYFKMSIRGEPVYPGDFLFPGEAANIAGGTKLIIPASIYLFALVIILLCIASRYLKLPDLGYKKRILFMSILTALTISSYPVYFANPDVQKAIGAQDAIWNQVYNYEKNGLLNAFLMQVKYLQINKPAGYSKQAAEKLLSSVSKKNVTTTTKPNVIVIMNESFWDPTRLPNVEFNIDPLENFRKIQSQAISGDLLVEPFGGNTANTEFEALTGFSMNALPGGVAYQQYVKRKMPSFASILKDNGYSTIAIHPYDDWFWNRKVVYPMLGIDEFLSETSFSKSEYKGRYVSDKAVGDKIISSYESAQSTDKPFFAHIVTMQNHGWYNTDRYQNGEQQVLASSKKLNEQMILELNTYSQGVKDSGDNTARLVEYFSKVEEPTIIMSFGDHLPSIGRNYGLYRSTGFVGAGDFSDEEYSKLHRTPFLIWSNTTNKAKDVGVINANYLVPTMMQNLDVTTNNYFQYLSEKMDGAKACNKIVCIDKSGKYISAQSKSVSEEINNQAILQYYYMFD